MQKPQNPKNIWRPLGSPNVDPVFSGPRAKIKNPLPIFCLPHDPISKKVWHDPVGPKPREEIELAKTAIFWSTAQPGGPAGLGHPPKNYLNWVGLYLKFSWKSPHPFKSYITFSWGQTDRHTTLYPYTWEWKIFPAYFLPSHSLRSFTRFARSLTSFVRINISSVQNVQ